MLKKLTIKDDNDKLVYTWKCGRYTYVLDSNWNYKHNKQNVINIRDEISKLEKTTDRVNKKINIFRHNSDNHFYTDGNTDPWIITANFILEVLSQETGLEYRGKYLHGERISIIDRKKDLIPSNILVDNRKLSDIICEIFDYDSTKENALKDFKCILKYCTDQCEIDSLFFNQDDNQKLSLYEYFKRIEHSPSQYNEAILSYPENEDELKLHHIYSGNSVIYIKDYKELLTSDEISFIILSSHSSNINTNYNLVKECKNFNEIHDVMSLIKCPTLISSVAEVDLIFSNIHKKNLDYNIVIKNLFDDHQELLPRFISVLINKRHITYADMIYAYEERYSLYL